jgi:hypothetical protein
MTRYAKALIVLIALLSVLVIFMIRLAGLMIGNKVLAGLGIGVSTNGGKHAAY